MSPIIPILAIGALIGLAMGARNKKPQVMHALPPPAPETHAAPARPAATSHATPAPATTSHATQAPATHGPRSHAGKPSRAPAPTRVVPAPPAPPQTLPDLAEQAHSIFTTQAPPGAGPSVATVPVTFPEPMTPAAPSVVEVTAPAVDFTPPPPPAAVPVPITAPAPGATLPAGFDADKARRTAPRIATHLKAKGLANYSRQALREFQTLAGLKPDGIYGGATAGALRYYLGGATPPKPMFAPLQEVPYTPPGG